MSNNPSFSLNDKYSLQKGKIILTGVQALVRIPIDQYLADKAKGLNTATFISGYRGSPLGVYDMNLQREQKLLEQHHIVFKPGLNEELAVTSVWGSQLTDFYPKAKYDGVKGIWYGKSPGVDRSGDALKHANFAGVSKNGGVLAFAGDDPISKSSTIPCISELAFYDAMMPVLYPGTVQEVIDYGRYGFELSRYCGFWVGFKCVTDLMDGFGTAEAHAERIVIRQPDFDFKGQPWAHVPSMFPVGPPMNVIQEQIMEDGRMEAARAFIKANGLNKITINPANAKVGIISAGKNYYDSLEALHLLGLKEADIERYGIRMLKLGAIFPIEPSIIHEFAKGLDKVIIIEEKRDLVENQVTRILYHSPYKPLVIGKKDETGKSFVPSFGETSPDLVSKILVSQLKGILPIELIQKRIEALQAVEERPTTQMLSRTPFYCSGCPHNTSTMQVPEGAIIGAGIGCHGMVVGMQTPHTSSITPMGGEGALWVGLQPFMDIPHFFQNIGDGTFTHSGSLAVRHAIASGTNITYKILYNAAVAMTGGQTLDAVMNVPDITRMLEAEGVKKIIVTTDQLDKYPSDARWSNNSELMHRDRIIEAQEKLSKIKGVTVLIHDQGCAAELRRMRKKGIVEVPKLRVFINEEVCEGCNDCGVKSNCLSVQPIETAFGRKNIIDQSSCNLDFSCLKGDCPSFLTVVPDKDAKKKKATTIDKISDLDLDNLPAPKMRVGNSASVYMMGIGGTGVVTVNQILGTAALLDGKEVNSLDQIGLSQKGGAVISHFKIVAPGEEGSNRIATGGADAYIGFDILTAATDKALQQASPGKTLAVISTNKTPTGMQLRIPGLAFPNPKAILGKIEEFTDKVNNIYFDSTKVSGVLFGSNDQANIILIGAAYQAGVIPIAPDKIEAAIQANKVKVQENTMAFKVGRRLVLNPELISEFEKIKEIDKKAQTISNKTAELIAQVSMNSIVEESLKLRVPELIAYQNSNYAQQYIDFLKKVTIKEQAVMPGSTRLTETVIKYLYKLMAYKDEYEVARLHTKKSAIENVKKQFGDNANVAIMLHPPIFRAMGLNKKIRFGSWTFPFFRLMASAKFLRGTVFDIFGYAKVRQVERGLINDYKALMENEINQLTPATFEKVVALAALPDVIKGYEEIKLNNVEVYRKMVAELTM